MDKYQNSSKILEKHYHINGNQFYQNDFAPYDIITIESGEKIKNIDTTRYIYGRLVELDAERPTFIIVIGGGIVGSSCAYYLSQAGVRVHLVDKGALGPGLRRQVCAI
mgnify:CR=1 FL=1